MNQKIDIKSHYFQKDESIFLDTSVWLYIYGPLVSYGPSSGIDYKSQVYTKAYKEMRQSGCKLFTDRTVISEFINRYARMEWEQTAKERFPDFKNYRNTREFILVAEAIKREVKKILGKCELCTSLEKPEIEALIEELANNDYNDLVIHKTCSKCKYILITDDLDFETATTCFMTANRRLLQQ